MNLNVTNAKQNNILYHVIHQYLYNSQDFLKYVLHSIVIHLRQIILVFHQIFIPTTFLQNIISIFNQIFESLSLS